MSRKTSRVRSSVWRHLLIVAFVTGSALATSCSRDKSQPESKTVKRQVVAKLARASGQVSRRAAQTIRWDEASVGTALYHRDALKTAEDASAKVVFESGGELQMSENALVIIEAPVEAPTTPDQPATARAPAVARVEKGVVRGVVAPGAAPMRVLTPDGREARITSTGDKPTKFRVTVKDEGKLEVAVIDGAAEVKVDEQTEQLQPGQAVDVAKGGRIAKPVKLLPYPKLLTPQVDAKLHAGTQLELGWEPIDGAALYRVQVSPDVGFHTRDVDQRLTVARFVLPELSPGKTYVWRVSAIDRAGYAGEFGFARRFHVLSAKPPPAEQLMSPPDNAGIQYVKRPQPVTFRWRSDAKSFELVIARHAKLSRRVTKRVKVNTSEATVEGLRRGVYYWGVYRLDGDERKPLFAKARKLVVAKKLPPGVRVPRSIGWR